MKSYIILLPLVFGLLISCSNDDTKPLIVTTSDLTTTVSDNVQIGDVVAEVPGTSNQGSVKFSLISQTPSGVFKIGEDYGELIVADATALDASVNQQIVIEVQVSKDNIVKTSTVTIAILGACLSQFDPAPGDWILVLEDTALDSWDVGSMSVNIDGTSNDYAPEFDLSTQSFVINVPEGTKRLFFTYNPSDFPQENIFTIINPDGGIVFEEGPDPTSREICFDDWVPIEEIPCSNSNFAPPFGDWILDMIDFGENGWDGAFITATIDGVSTDYAVTADQEIAMINVPDGTQSLMFSYTPGDFEEEHLFFIVDPSGNLVKEGGPNPTPGELCND